jgi:hypothetical protein
MAPKWGNSSYLRMSLCSERGEFVLLEGSTAQYSGKCMKNGEGSVRYVVDWNK